MGILGHVLFLLAIICTFFAASLALIMAEATKGSRISKAAKWEAVGLIFVAIGVFLSYAGAITGQLDLLRVTAFWPILGVVVLTGFACVCYSKWHMMKVI